MTSTIALRILFKYYRISLKTFLDINEVQDEEKKKIILQASLRKELQDILQRLSAQDELDQLSYDEILARLEQELRPDEPQDTVQEPVPQPAVPTPEGSLDIRDTPMQDTTKITVNSQDSGKTAINPLPYKLRDPLPTFCGRDEYLQELTTNLDSPDCNVVVVHGLTGVGKSELCNQYAWKHMQLYHNNIIWIHGEHLKEEFLNLARDLNVNTRYTGVGDKSINEIIKDVYSQLRVKSVCLLVIDNVLTRDRIIEFLPGDQHKNIRVLITSPYAHWEGVRTVKLLPLTSKESEDIFQTVIANKICFETQKNDFEKLVKIVNGIPLAVQICATYISYELNLPKSNFTLNVYLNELENHRKILENFILKSSKHDYNNTIYISLKTTLEKIKQISRNPKLSDASEILNVCVYLNTNAIPQSLLQEICRPKDLSEGIKVLNEFSLIFIDQDGQIRMHKLVQKSIIQLLDQEKSEENSKWFQKVLVHFLTCSEPCDVQLKSVLSHAQRYIKVLLELCQNQLYITKLLRLLVIHDYNFVLKGIFKHIKDLNEIKKIVRGSNLVHEAVRYNKRMMVEYLLDYEDDLDRLDDEELSPLMVAAALSLEDVAELLILRGAHLRIANNNIEVGDGKNPASTTWTDLHGNTLLHLAARHGLVGLCDLRLAATGCDVNAKNKDDYSPIHLAAQEGHVEVLRRLLEVGKVAVDTLGSQWCRTALMEAARGGHNEVVRCLLQHKASMQKGDTAEWSALHHASYNGHTDTVKLLTAEEGCEVNAQNKYGYCPLHLAAWRGHLDVVRALCDKGARGDIPDYDGYTPMSLASGWGKTAVCRFLKERFPG